MNEKDKLIIQKQIISNLDSLITKFIQNCDQNCEPCIFNKENTCKLLEIGKITQPYALTYEYLGFGV